MSGIHVGEESNFIPVAGGILLHGACIFVEMKAVKSNTRSLAEARRLEQEGEIEQAAAAYQQVLAGEPANEEAVERLLVIYRKQKDYKKELAVIEGALSAYEDRDKAIQAKWIAAHPEAAKVGREFLRSLGGASVSAFGSNRVVGRLLKRKEVVDKRLGKKGEAAGAGQRRKGAVQ
jgi:tetratricopeptide (TPR) repeat protein